VGKWRSFDNSEHYHINITFDFKSDNTYQANVLALLSLHFSIGEDSWCSGLNLQ
jgi:hypothetical protein